MSEEKSGGSHKRSTYLVDRSFQLKYAALIVALTLVVSVPLGWLLHREISEAVRMADEASDASKAALEQVTLLNRRLEMETMLRYKDDPKALADTKRANALEGDRLNKLGSDIAAQRTALEQKKKMMGPTLALAIAFLVFCVAMASVFATHRVAGPIQRMRLLFREVRRGNFPHEPKLRKGDELQEFFSEFLDVVDTLEKRHKADIERLDRAIATVEQAPEVNNDSLALLKVARNEMTKVEETEE